MKPIATAIIVLLSMQISSIAQTTGSPQKSGHSSNGQKDLARSQSDFDEIAFRGVREIEASHTLSYTSVPVYVLDAAVDGRAHRALSKLRTVIEIVPSDDRYVLPKGYVHVLKFDVTGDDAEFEANRGPVPRHAMLDCGLTKDMHFHRVNGKWVGGEATDTMC